MCDLLFHHFIAKIFIVRICLIPRSLKLILGSDALGVVAYGYCPVTVTKKCRAKTKGRQVCKNRAE
jgi:hypothetical protein